MSQASLVPFLRVPDVARAKQWYESIGMQCIATHQEAGCGLDWAMMQWQGARFMLYIQLPQTIPHANNCGLYFEMENIDGMRELLAGKATIVEEISETAYGRKEITFHDCYGFQVSFSCPAGK